MTHTKELYKKALELQLRDYAEHGEMTDFDFYVGGAMQSILDKADNETVVALARKYGNQAFADGLEV